MRGAAEDHAAAMGGKHTISVIIVMVIIVGTA
jgi:hypothetical protein